MTSFQMGPEAPHHPNGGDTTRVHDRLPAGNEYDRCASAAPVGTAAAGAHRTPPLPVGGRRSRNAGPRVTTKLSQAL